MSDDLRPQPPAPEPPRSEASPLKTAGSPDRSVPPGFEPEPPGPAYTPVAAPPAILVTETPTTAPIVTETVRPVMEPPLGEGEGAPLMGGGWLPTLRQAADALRLNLPAAIGPDPDWPFFRRGLHSSMRQALGLIVVVTLLAGLPALISNWVGLAERHTTLQLLQAQGVANRLSNLAPAALVPNLALELGKTAELVSGLTPVASPQVAAGLSALSAWLALPFRVLAVWLAYGLLVLVVAKALGAGTTLPRFYAATGYAVLPLLLSLLFPLPVIGPWIALVGALLAVVSYVLAVVFVTGLDRWRALIAVLLPAAALALAGVLLGSVLFLLGA